MNIETQEAWLDDIMLEMETLDDVFEKSIVRHEFPYRDGALLEDMGQKARTVRMRCYFWDSEEQSTYNDHIALINHLQSRELVELIHPKYGIIKGCVEQVNVRHDDRLRTAEIDLTFVENLRSPIEDSTVEDVEAATEEEYLDSVEEQQAELAADMGAALGSEAAAILNQELDPDLGIVEQFTNVSLAARNYLKTVEAYVTTLEAELTTIANPANSLIAAIDYGVNLPGRVIGAVARTVERYAILYDSLKTAPVRFFNSLILGLKELETASGKFGKTTKIGAASYSALQAAYVYKADEAARAKQKKAETAQPFDSLGRYTAPEATAPVMASNDLERSLADVRGYLQEAVDLSRQAGSLKAMALSLLTHVNTVKLERELIVQVELDNPLPLHLVCLMRGLPYQAAERLLAINDIRNPNVTAGTVNVYAR